MTKKRTPGGKNRTHGEGTIVRDRNRWRGQILLPNGLRKSVFGDTTREVHRKLDAIKYEIAAGMHGTLDGELTLREWAEKWIETQKHHIAITTEENYRSLIRLHLDRIGDVPLSKVTPLLINDHYTRKLATYSSTYVNHIHVLISSMLEEAVNLEILARNPARRVKVPPIKTEEMEPLTEEQSIQLLSIARGHRFEAEIMIGLATGAREAELLGLRWQDVLWRKGSIHIRTTLKRLHGAYFLKEPKSKSSGRIIPIGEYALALLHEREQKQAEMRDLVG